MTTPAPRLLPANIAEAGTTIDPVFRDTPQVAFEPLSEAVGADVVLKVETLNPIRAFKGRGTYNFVRRLCDRTPLVVASAGNFGQGMAYAARAHGIPITVFAATTANRLKVDRMRALGAEMMLHGRDFDAAKDAAADHARRHGLRYVEDGREPAISEGAGTIAVELLRWPDPFDAVLVPVGNGALINGIGTWVKAKAPSTRVIGVCARGAPAMERSWRLNRVETTLGIDTIADGIGVRVPVPEALADMRGIVDDILLVDDEAILQAMRLILHHTGLLTEPAGAAGVAALLAHRERFAGQRIATPLCGANVTETQFREWFCGGGGG